MDKKRNGFNILGCIALAVLLGSSLLSLNPIFREQSRLEAKIEQLLKKEGFALRGDMRKEFTSYLIDLSKEYGFDPLLIMAIMKVESAFDSRAASIAGAYGLLQVKPVAAQEVATVYGERPIWNYELLNPFTNVRIGVQYLAWLRDFVGKNRVRMLSAYNLGPTWVKKRRFHSHKYANKVLRAYRFFKKQTSSV